MAQKIRFQKYPDSMSYPGWVLPSSYVTPRGKFTEELISFISDRIPDGAKILDLNGGEGEVGKALVSRGYSYLALEQNPLLREVLASKGLESQDWRIPNSKLPSSQFDMIIAMTFIEHIPTWIAAFELLLESRRLLKQGGSMLIVAPNGPGNGRVFWEDYKHGWYVSRERLSDMAVGAGLVLAESRYTLGWITLSSGPLTAIARFFARVVSTVLSLPWIARMLEAVGLSSLLRKVHKTLFEQVLVRLTKVEG